MSNLYQYNGKEWIEISGSITGEEVVKKINDLEPIVAKQIDFQHIKNFPWHLTKGTGGDGGNFMGYGAYDLNIKSITLGQITANQNNYATGLGSWFRISSDAARTITGFEGGTEGRGFLLTNVGSFNITIAHQSASSGAINRVLSETGANVVLIPDDSAWIFYDNTTERWRLVMASTSSGHTIRNAGTDLTQRTGLNFLAPLTATDDAAGDETEISVVRTGVYRTFSIKAGEMEPRVTNGAAYVKEEYATNDVNLGYFLFDGATSEGIQFIWTPPDEYNLGTVKMKLYWDAGVGASNGDGVVFGIKAGALSNDDAIDAALGTEVTVTDAVIAVGDLHITPASGAITIGGTPALGDMVVFQITRNPADASDTMTEDCKLIGVSIQYLENSVESAAW